MALALRGRAVTNKAEHLAESAVLAAELDARLGDLEGQVRADFIATWIALSGGLPDMLRTATNCTGDGFTAITFDRFLHRFLPAEARAGSDARSV